MADQAPPRREALIVLYDADCGFCRWAAAWALRRDRRDRLVAAAIQSPLGAELLGDLSPDERLASAHAVGADGRRRSGGAAATEVLEALEATAILGRLARRLSPLTDRVYDTVAARRMAVGRLVGERARQRADRLLESRGVATAAELEARLRRAAS
ncbi:MAG TPA: DCC1-like thiol-disulfide oxidoreductase family protein [Solirubrobacteraceae bacterium]|nr:DCC1-like thiol-disulfide oxidoreductase family protein [Solirubrobacteraceae bacterium]